jgi:hypothetical protein
MIEIDKSKQSRESPAPYLKDGPSINDVAYYYREAVEAFTQNQKQKEQKEQEQESQ